MLKEKWRRRGEGLPQDKVKELSQKYGVSEEAVAIAASRGITEFEEYFGPGTISRGSDMLDMKHAVYLLDRMLLEGKKIRIIGDYDMDGVMSTWILYSGLNKLIQDFHLDASVTYRVPDRIKDGYGVNERLIREAHQEKIDCILTCDNGIAAFEPLELAKEQFRMCVIVTDHHRIPTGENGSECLVMADAIINPHREGDPTAFKDICGAVVAYKLLCNLYEAVGLPDAACEQFLGYAAFATVTDMMPLVGENRAVVKHGLPLVKKNCGLDMLCASNGFAREHVLTSEDIGYTLGPCGNAAGRIGDIMQVFDLLDSPNWGVAIKVAYNLVELNEERKALCYKAEEKAVRIAQQQAEEGSKVLVIYLPGTHEGIIGIVAGRIREKFNRPAFVFTDAEKGLKGSGRSTETWDMFVHLSAVKELMLAFGGHPGAAGLTVESEEKLTELRAALNRDCGITEEDLIRVIYYDDEISIDSIDVDFVEGLSALEPTGNGNESPVFFLRGVEGELSILGKDYQTVKVVPGSGAVLMAFHAGDEAVAKASKKYRIPEDTIRFAKFTGDRIPVKVCTVGKAGINDFKGNKSAQIIMDSYVFV